MDKKPDPHLPIGDKHGARVLKRLYAMTGDEAIEETLTWCEEDHPHEARFPINRWTGAQELRQWHKQFQAGNKAAVLEALHLCTLNDLPIPRWCAMGYLAAYREVRFYRAGSWDDVFGRPHKKGTHLGAKRQHREKSLRVYNRIREILRTEPSTPVDGHLFERVGKEFGTGGKTKTEEYYYEWKKRLKL